jgi:immune inhibitor A
VVALAALAAIPCGATAGEPPSRGDLRLLVVLASFSDRALTHQREHFTGGPGSLLDRLVGFYQEVSAGRLRIVPVVGQALVTLPNARATYVQHPDAIARDALAAFASAASDPLDRAALRDADALLVFFAGPGRESHTRSGDPNDPWSNWTTLTPPAAAPGARGFDEACVIAEEEVPPFSPFGVLCHEFGHLLGLPELYAPGGLPQEGIGGWGLMGQGTWLGRGEQPPHMCAWSKLRLGWAEVETIERSTRGVALPAVETVPRVVKIPAVPGRPEEYYLLENRARIGADAALRGEGLLIWHVDESVGSLRTAESDVAHKLLHLVEADGRGDLDRGQAAGGNRGDASDPWAGPPPWRRRAAASLAGLGALLVGAAVWRAARARPVRPALALLAAAAATLATAWAVGRDPACGPGTPGMAPYDGSPGRVTIRNISPAGPVMHFDVLVAPGSTPD